MLLRVALVYSAGLLILPVFSIGLSYAQGVCGNLLGKQVTLRGEVISVDRLQIGNTKFDVIIARTTDPSCGTIQTTGKHQSCNVGMRFVGTGQLRAGPASRSAGNRRAGATDYGFEPIRDDGLCHPR